MRRRPPLPREQEYFMNLGFLILPFTKPKWPLGAEWMQVQGGVLADEVILTLDKEYDVEEVGLA